MSMGMSRWSGPVGGKNWARKAWEAGVKEEEQEADDDAMVAVWFVCVMVCVRRGKNAKSGNLGEQVLTQQANTH